ncbi:MAG: twin-arginine translocase TatA/TatE family subunit [Candidatus Bathyarchaeia archaeon]
MFIGPWEIILAIVIILILFGPKKLPELAKSIGQAIREYKKATKEISEPIEEVRQTAESIKEGVIKNEKLQ